MVCRLISIYFDSPQLGHTIKINCIKVKKLTQRCAQFRFFRKGSGYSFSTTFCAWFFKKMFFMLYSTNWPNFIVWLHLLFEISGNACIAIACFSGCDVINFEINLIFLIKSFFYMTKKSRQIFKYLEKEKSF